jgi:hypothetical protein
MAERGPPTTKIDADASDYRAGRDRKFSMNYVSLCERTAHCRFLTSSLQVNLSLDLTCDALVQLMMSAQFMLPRRAIDSERPVEIYKVKKRR